jgi:kinesin family protein 3/17
MQLEMQAQKEREKLLIEEKMRKEEEVLLVETNYQNLQEEVDDMRKLIKNFRVRYKQAVNEIRDLNEEHAKDQAEYFESVQTYERELALFKSIIMTIIDPKELQKLEQKCSYDEENAKWVVPYFTVGQKQVSFPKLKLLNNQKHHD